MRSAMLTLLLGIAIVACFGLVFLGCSSDDDSTTGTQGNINDPDFIAVHNELNEFVDSTIAWFEDGLGSMSSLATDTIVDPVQYSPSGSDFVTDSASAEYVNGWHVVYLGFHSSDYTGYLQDSIQFLKSNTPQQNSTDIDQLVFKQLKNFTPVDTTVSYHSYRSDGSFTFGNLNTIQALISGTKTQVSVSKDVSGTEPTWRTITIEANLSNVAIDKTGSGWMQYCPASGTMTATITMVYQQGTATPDTTSWNLTLTFNEGLAQSTLTSGDVFWNYNAQECTTPGS